jgi:hypothetical protein
MEHRTRRRIAVAAALGLVVAGGIAFAAGNAHSGTQNRGHGSIRSAVTNYLGLSARQLRTDLADGETLAQITTAQGKSVSGLEQTIESAVKARLDQALASGRMTSRQEQSILSRLAARIDRAVSVPHPAALLRRRLLPRVVLSASAAYLGLTKQQLRARLHAGQTLAQVATAQGKTTTGLEQAIETGAKTRLDQAVASGRLTAGREQRILTRLGRQLDRLVNRTFTHP